MQSSRCGERQTSRQVDRPRIVQLSKWKMLFSFQFSQVRKDIIVRSMHREFGVFIDNRTPAIIDVNLYFDSQFVSLIKSDDAREG